MIHLVFSIHDQKAQAYLPPFILPTLAMAKRTFSDCVNDIENHAFGKHPYDYTLFQLGAWNDENGFYSVEKHPKVIGNGLEFKSENYDPQQPELELVQKDK